MFLATESDRIIVPHLSQVIATDNYRLSPVESRFIGQLSHVRLREAGVFLKRNQLTSAIGTGK